MGLSFHEMQAAAQEMSLRAVLDEDLSNYTLCDDGRYEVYTEYTDDAVSEVDKHKNITVNEEQCNLTQEENSQYVPFKLPRYWDGVDLMTKLIQFHYVNINGGSGISTAVNVRFNDSYIICGWLINKSVTAVAGDVTFEITATGTNEKSADYRWRTRPNGKFTVLEALSYDGIIEPSDDWYAGFVKSMQEYTTKAAESARSAQDYADQSKSNLDQVTQITETFTTNAQEVKETAINEINNAKVSGVNAVEAAATEIVNDREKITENANNISSLKGDLDNIIETEHSRNLLDTTKLKNGFLQNNGTISTAEWALDYWYTDIIKCGKNNIVYANGTVNPLNQLGGLYRNGAWIAQLSSNATITKVQDTKDGNFYFKIIFNDDCPEFDGIVINTINLDDFNKKFVMLDCNEPYIYEQYDDFAIKVMLSKDVEAQSITKALEDDIIAKATKGTSKIVNCWGDSLTRGVGGGDYNTKTYPAYLQNFLGSDYVVNNLGVGGEPSETIGFREGGITGYVQPCTIPSSGSVNIEIKSDSGSKLYPMAQTPNTLTGGGVNPIKVNGIIGDLSYDSTNRTVVFTRKDSGTESILNKPTPIFTNGMKEYADGIKIIWAGTNNKIKIAKSDWNMGTLSYYLNGAGDYIDNVLNDIDNIIGGTQNYIVIGMTSKTYMPEVESINKVMAHKYGKHFLDVRTLLLTSGLEDAEITPTEQDITDISDNEIPISLRSDDTHFNAKGYENIAKYVFAKGQYLGYWN